MQFGDILRNLIEEKEITQKQLADRLNLGLSTLGNYINNIREPDFKTLKRIASYFDVTTDYLLNYQTDIHKGNTQAENDALRIIRSLTSEQRKVYVEQGKALLKLKPKKNTTIVKNGIVYINKEE